MIVPGAGAKPRAGSSALSRISSACPAAARGRSATSGSPGRDPQLLADDVDPGHELADGVLDLQAGVQLDEVERAVRRRAGTRRCRRSRSRSCGRRARRPPPSPRASPASSAGDGDSSISFWWRRWIEHSRSPRVSTPPSLSQSTWISTCRAGHERLLEVERPVRERRFRLGARGRVGSLELVRPVHEPHALAAAARDRLQQHREAELARGRAHLGERGAALGARHERHAGSLHLRLRLRLVAHPLHHVRARPDEDEVVAPRRRGRRPGSRRGSRSRGAPPRSRSSRRRRSRTGSGGSSRDADGGPMQTARSASRTWSASASAVE